MRRTVWTIRTAFLLVSAGLLVAAVQIRRDSETTELGRLDGITGQRQAISFRVRDDGRPQAFSTVLFSQCPNVRDYRTSWTPSDGARVPFRWRGDRLSARERSSFEYANGTRGFALTTMTAHAGQGRVDGFMRSVWRFERQGREYMVCDSGYVPFATGARAGSRLSRVALVRAPVTLYPAAPERLPASLRRLTFARWVDATCGSSYRALIRGERRARRLAGDRWRVRRAYVRGHAGQLAALLRLGRPPEAEATYARWLRGFAGRVELERRQLGLLQRGDLDRAASLAARLATLKALGNAAGIAFGLRACTSDGPVGA
ncbi:MAG: hypothetical protein QOE60_304, partial [Thermoleophilaceae bacterium]|nr:hypothetical protein [Thermoleophilaceae bacterium]